MRQIINLSYSYLKHYKKQTMALFLGIVLSTAIFTGIGSLMESGRIAAMDHVRTQYGDWHYALRCDFPWYENFEKNKQGEGYRVEKSGVLTIRKVLNTPYNIAMAYGDTNYMDIMGRKMIEGHYPQKDFEVAADSFTLRNLGCQETIGSKLVLDNETFVLSGVLSGTVQKGMQIFLSKNLDYGKNGQFLYLKFSEKKNVYCQAKAFTKAFGMKELGQLSRNNNLTAYLGGDTAEGIFEIIKTGINNKGFGLPYIWGNLNQQWNLTHKAVLGALGLFSAFIIYSLFQVSVVKRRSQYSIMQTLGMDKKRTFEILVIELFLIFLVGYPVGCALGNGIGALFYKENGQIFVPPKDMSVHLDSGVNQVNAVWNLPQPGNFHISTSVVAGGALFLGLLLIFISWRLVNSMEKMTLRQMMTTENGKKKNRKIYSKRRGSLTGTLTKKFMLERKGALAGMLISLSIGGVIFLGTVFVTENTKINNDLSFKADDGLGSDIEVYMDSDSLSQTVTENVTEQLKKIDGLESVSPVRYMLGELSLQNGVFRWPQYYPETANKKGRKQKAELLEKYNGMIVQIGKEDYKLKVNIYGYDDKMLKELEPYLLEGTIDPDQMRAKNTVILKTLMDGQGNYDGIAVKQGQRISLKTPVNKEKAILKFQSEDKNYQQQNFIMAALASRPLAKVDTFIGDDGETVDLIMTNEQMERNFGVRGYQTISIDLKKGLEGAQAADQIRKKTAGIPHCVVKDYTGQIQVQNLFLTQKMAFFYGVTLILLAISLLHIMNTMQYLVAARSHEFGILRAMGITHAGFRKMLLREGIRYGIYSSAVTILLYLAVQKTLYYFLVHIYLYLQPKAVISPLPVVLIVVVNLVICVVAVLFSGQTVLKKQIISQIRE